MTSARAAWLRPGTVAALVGVLASTAMAEEPPAGIKAVPDYTELTLEQLLEVDLVFAASRRSQSVGEAPSMVTVIGRPEIRRQGYRTLADLLRAVPGFYVATDHNYTYLGVRGFARPGDYNGRVLILLNGVRLNDNVYDSVLIGHDFVMDLDLVERVEIARGPAASLYGNNAFFAVVNVVTRTGAQLRGTEVAGDVGSFGSGGARATWGQRFSSGLDLVASASSIGSRGQDFCYAEYAAEGGCTHGLNGESARSGFLTASWRGFQAQAVHNWRRKEIPTGSYDVAFGDPRNRTWDGLTRGSLQYAHAGQRSSVTARIDHGRYRYTGEYVYPEAPNAGYSDGTVGRWWTLDGSSSLSLGKRHLLTAGAEFQWDVHMDQYEQQLDPAETFLDARADGRRWGVYVQDEAKLTDRVRLLLGARFDVAESGLRRTSPRVALVHSGPKGAIKLLYGNAFRAPNQYEQSYYAGTPELRAETIRTLELVAERNVGERVRVSASAFNNRIQELITLTGEADLLTFTNAGDIHSHGFELVGDWRGQMGARARLSYTYQRTTDDSTGITLSNSPGHLAKASLDAPLFAGRVWAGGALQYTSARRTLGGATLPAFTLVDVTLHAPSLWPHLDFTLGVSNLFDSPYVQPGSEEHRQDALVQHGRDVRLRAVWRF